MERFKMVTKVNQDKNFDKLMKKSREGKERNKAIAKKQGKNYEETGLKTNKSLRKDTMLAKKQKEEGIRASRRSERFAKGEKV